MKHYSLIVSFLFLTFISFSQNVMTPELLWKLGRVHGRGVSTDGKNIIYSVTTPDIEQNKSFTKIYSMSIDGGSSIEIHNADSLLTNKNISPDGKYIIFDKEVKLKLVKGKDFYPELSKSNVYIYDELDHRHWDHWNEGNYSHVFVANLVNGKPGNEKDIMKDEPYYSPQQPFGGDEDYVWNPDSRHILYVTKKKSGKDYMLSTNTDIYEYDVNSGSTKNITTGMLGYDQNPAYNKSGTLAWLSMKREGYEADKQDLVIRSGNSTVNLTHQRDDIQVSGFKWSNDGSEIFFWAPQKATQQVFKVNIKSHEIKQITKGKHEITEVIGESGNHLIVSLQNMNSAAELYTLDKTSGELKQLTHVNDAFYSSITKCKTELRNITSIDGKQMPTWIIYPPDFDPSKKYPTLLFCLGGPQGTTPHYSMRWNLQLMASSGYIVVAPDRRGVYGDGTKWTEQVSKDWSGLVMQDYLYAIDNVSKEKFVDKNRLGCVGASFGGFSVFMLESLHNGRFKTFISHDGVFDYKSMAGTTDELWFVNWELGGNFWDTNNPVVRKSFSNSPSNFISKWKTPIMIVQGGRDYRVPIEQGLQAFQAAQLRGIKSRLIYIPDENHWVLSPQNALVWQHEFFKWLKETL